MILSVHIPKTGGISFRHFLQEAFGPRLMLDYDDWLEVRDDEGLERNRRNRAAMLARVDDIRAHIDVVHGHYLPGKYLSAFPNAPIATILRDPYQHAISTYHFARRQLRGVDESTMHPGLRRFRDEAMTVAATVEAWPDHQSSYLSGIPVADIAMIGVTEDLDRSIAIFQKIFDLPVRPTSWRDNANPDQGGRPYEVPDDVRRAVRKHRAGDIELYRQGRERFEALARHHGV